MVWFLRISNVRIYEILFAKLHIRKKKKSKQVCLIYYIQA
jgi:hypothetical protein